MDSYRTLLETLDNWFARGRELAGPGVIPCQRSCSACCHGVFDISPADAHLLREALAVLPAEQAAGLLTRAEAQLRSVAERLPDWGPPWDVDDLPEASFDELCDELALAPCPALSTDGGCAVYDHRPATCRLTGLGLDGGPAGGLDNECPIQERFPDYAALAPVPFELMAFEDSAEQHDALALARGCRTTTVAGALVG